MKKILPFFLLVLLLASCQKDPDMSKLSDDFVVFTDHSKDANFESFTTFYIPDSVMVIGSSEKPEFWSATEADDIVSTLVSGMEGRGYTRASDKESADLGLQVSFVKNVNYFTNYHDIPYCWWGFLCNSRYLHNCFLFLFRRIHGVILNNVLIHEPM